MSPQCCGCGMDSLGSQSACPYHARREVNDLLQPWTIWHLGAHRHRLKTIARRKVIGLFQPIGRKLCCTGCSKMVTSKRLISNLTEAEGICIQHYMVLRRGKLAWCWTHLSDNRCYIPSDWFIGNVTILIWFLEREAFFRAKCCHGIWKPISIAIVYLTGKVIQQQRCFNFQTT